MDQMTPTDVQKRVDYIRSIAADDEAAHAAEDGMRADVLLAIAESRCTNPIECDRLALTTDDVEFARWCA